MVHIIGDGKVSKWFYWMVFGGVAEVWVGVVGGRWLRDMDVGFGFAGFDLGELIHDGLGFGRGFERREFRMNCNGFRWICNELLRLGFGPGIGRFVGI